jgi:hypothetical protein
MVFIQSGQASLVSSSTPKTIKFVKSAIVLLIIAAAFYGMAQYLRWGLEADSLEFPVNLSGGREYSGDFQAKWNVYYEIRLDSERNLDLQEQNCLLGIETIVPERCAGIPSELLLSWRVETNNSIVASGDSDASNEGYWGLKMGKVLGSFPAKKGKIYRVQVQIERSSSTLQKTNPGIKIEIRSEDLKWTYVWIGMLIQAAAFCFLLALLLLLILCGHNIRARLNSIDR